VIVALLRPLARLVALVVLAALALAGLAVAVLSVPGDGLARAAEELGLGDAVDAVAAYLATPTSPWIAVGAAALALAVAAGALLPRRSRLLTLGGGLPVRAHRRAVKAAADGLARRRHTASTVRVRLRRRRLTVDAAFPPGSDARSGVTAIERALGGLSSAFGLRTRVRSRAAGRGARVR
jgi:hypothetical protein